MLNNGDFITNETGKEANMLLFGRIGMEIDGNEFARELEMLSRMPDISGCRIKINSLGGSVAQGYSILSAIDMLREKNIPVYTECVGVAYSIAGIIFCYGDKGRRSIVDYGTVMIHDPKFAFGGADSDAKKLMLQKTTESLASILEGNTSLSTDQTREYMTKETTFSAQEALEHGFADNIKQTGQKLQPMSNHYELMVACSDIYNNSINQKPLRMKKVAVFLGLNAEANEDTILDAVKGLKNQVSDIQALTDEKTTLEGKIKLLETELSNVKVEQATVLATDLIENAVKEGKLTEASKDVWIEKAKTDFDGVKEMVNGLTGVPKNINDQINDDANDGKELAAKFEKMMTETPELLDELPEAELKAMQDAYDKVNELNYSVIE